MTNRPSASTQCEDFLREKRAYNIEHKILRSMSQVIDCMLERGAELDAVYEELWTKLDPKAVEWFLSSVLDVGAFWHPDYLSAARQAYRRQVALRSEISKLANELAERLRERTLLGESSGFHTASAYHIVDLIEHASESNWDFRLHLQDSLSALRHQYDLKYWPSVADVVEAVAIDARNAEINPSDSITEAGTRTRKQSMAASVRALQCALEEYRRSSHSPIGRDFRLSDESWASILNVILDLDPDQLVDGSYIKRLRQRDRNAKQNDQNRWNRSRPVRCDTGRTDQRST